MIQAGKYKAIAIALDLGKSNGKDQIGVKFEFKGAPEQEGGEPETEVLTWYGYFTDKGKPIVNRSLRAAGWNGDIDALVAAAGGDRQAARALLPATVEIDVANEEYEGKWSWKINWVNELGGGGVAMRDKLDDAGKRSFAARMKGAFAGMGDGVGAPKAPASTVAPAGYGDHDEADGGDDIPF